MKTRTFCRLLPLIFIFLCASCSRQEKPIASNLPAKKKSNLAKSTSKTTVDKEAIGSDVRRKDDRLALSINAQDPADAFFQFSAAIKKYPEINHFIATWWFVVFRYSAESIARYDRTTKILKYRVADGDNISAAKSYYVFGGVTEMVIQKAEKNYDKSIRGDMYFDAWEDLTKYGAVMKVGGRSGKYRDQNTK